MKKFSQMLSSGATKPTHSYLKHLHGSHVWHGIEVSLPSWTLIRRKSIDDVVVVVVVLIRISPLDDFDGVATSGDSLAGFKQKSRIGKESFKFRMNVEYFE